MPEAYTHIRIGKHAAQKAQYQVRYPAVFGIGCQGPDILFCYQAWKSGKHRKIDLPKLASKIHHEKTGEFLQNLLCIASTPVQREYAAGFLCHYAADCTLHPYVEYLTQPKQLYDEVGGHGCFETALDSFLHKYDGGSGLVKLEDSCPALKDFQIREIAILLEKVIAATFGIQVQYHFLQDSYYHSRILHRIFVSRWRIKWAICWAIERLVFKHPRFITGHFTPMRLKQPLPKRWFHSAKKEWMQADIAQLIEQAENRAAELLQGYFRHEQGELTWENMKDCIGNYDYDTGASI